MLRKLLVACAVVLSAGVIRPASASADPINFVGVGKSAVISATLVAGAATYTRNVYAGELNWSWQLAAPDGFAKSFYAYCIDLANYLVSGQDVTVLKPGTTANTQFTNGVVDGGAKAAWLFDTFAATVHASGSGTDAAALQVAIWEAMYDTSNSLTGGNFKLATTGAVATQAATYLSALYGAGNTYKTDSATILATNSGQDQITASVPEPSTLLLLGFAGLGLLLMPRVGQFARR